jgi:hypothetical protein
MLDKTFNYGHGYVPKLTEGNYPIWKQKIREVVIVMKSYNPITGVEPLSLCNGVTLHAPNEEWQDRPNTVIALIDRGCCEELLPLIEDIDDPVAMREAQGPS